MNRFHVLATLVGIMLFTFLPDRAALGEVNWWKEVGKALKSRVHQAVLDKNARNGGPKHPGSFSPAPMERDVEKVA